MRKRMGAFALMIALLTGCAAGGADGGAGEMGRYEASFLTLFDTVTTIIGYAESEEAFRSQVQAIHDELEGYHQLYDIYHDYEGINNLKTVNDNAGGEAVAVEEPLMGLLLFCRDIYEETGGQVNAAMGSVLSLWHEAREAGVNDPEEAALPEEEALLWASEHTAFDDVILDEEASTVRIADPDLRLDVGAVAKGYAVQRVCENAPAGLLISVGGNVCATGPKADGGSWVVGIQDPDGGREEYLHTLNISSGSVVTSGDYQRYYTVDGVRYHHIIDPKTLYPAGLWRSVTILCEDSGLADALSTALFTLPQEEGQKLLDRYGAEAIWVAADGAVSLSPGAGQYIRT